MLRATNAARKKQPTHLQFAVFKQGEVLQMLGLLYGNCLSPTGRVEDMFNEKDRLEGSTPPNQTTPECWRCHQPSQPFRTTNERV